MPRNPLEAAHKALGAFMIERAGTPTASHYGDSRAEHAMVRSSVGVFDLCSAGKLLVGGEERLRFLQAMLAADVAPLAPGQGAYSLLLSRDGGIAAEMRVVHLREEVLLMTPSLARGKTRSVLDRHAAASAVSIHDESESLALLSLQGPAASRVLTGLIGRRAPELAPFASTTVQTAAFGPIVVVGAPRGGESGFDLIVPIASCATLFATLVEGARGAGGGPAGLEALEAMRVESGQPAYGADMDETVSPGELDDPGRGVSREKGCFLGRDAMERAIAGGAITRRLVGLLFSGLYPPLKADRLFLGEMHVGAVTSAAWSPMLTLPVALGLVATEASEPGTELFTIDDEPVVVAKLPFWEPAAYPPSAD